MISEVIRERIMFDIKFSGHNYEITVSLPDCVWVTRKGSSESIPVIGEGWNAGAWAVAVLISSVKEAPKGQFSTWVDQTAGLLERIQ